MIREKKRNLLEQLFFSMNLKKLFAFLSFSTLFFLLIISALGFRQYLLYQHCEQILSESDQLLFQYTAIKEHISSSLLTGATLDHLKLKQELEELNDEIQIIIDDILIPKEMKMAFISQVDLVSLIVQLRVVQDNKEADPKQLNNLGLQLQSISSRLQNFHKILASYTQTQHQGLHKIIVGTLALTVFLITSLLFLISRYVLSPILHLCATVGNSFTTKNQAEQDLTLVASMEHLESAVNQTANERKRLNNLMLVTDQLLKRVEADDNEQNLWQNLCTQLQTNPDYSFVWIGTPAAVGDYLEPSTGFGHNAMASEEWLENLSYLLKYCHQEGGICDTARKTLASHKPFIQSSKTSTIPEGLLKYISFQEDFFISASFPIMEEEKAKSVLTIYSTTPRCFGMQETVLLGFLIQWVSAHERFTTSTNICQQTAPQPASDMSNLYRFSALGLLTAGLAHELTDISNGAINYTQVLQDHVAEKSANQEEKMLLDKLFSEERKIADLATKLLQFTRDDKSQPKDLLLSENIDVVLTFIDKQLKVDGIELVKDIMIDRQQVEQDRADIQLVFLSLLLHSRAALLESNDDSIHKRIVVKAYQEKNAALTLMIQHPGDSMGKDTLPQSTPWPPFAFCHEILERSGGTLTTKGDGSTSTAYLMGLTVLQ